MVENMSFLTAFIPASKNNLKKALLICFLLLPYGCGGGDSSPPNSAPVAKFTVSTDNGIAPLAVQFDATGSSDSDGTISSYKWNFGDTGTGTGSTVQHTYRSAGTYTARLTVTDDGGLTDTASHTIEVSADPATLTYTISGTVTSAEHMLVDSDVNDPRATYVSNDSFSSAQEISAPVTVSGFVNVDNTGSHGDRFYPDGDYDDYYHVILTGGMTISVYMSEAQSGSELNLYLYDRSRTLVSGGSTSTAGNGIVSLTVPDDGSYYIRVEAAEYLRVRTFTLYALTIGLTGTAAAQYPLRLGDDFVPGEVLVRFVKGTADIKSSSSAESKAVTALGFTTRAGNTCRDKLLVRPKDIDKDAFFEKLGIRAAVRRSMDPGNMDHKTREKLETLWMVRALRKKSDIRYAEPNYIRRALLAPNDRYYSYQWHYPLISLPDAWDITTGSSNVVVAVVDTGVLLNHPDLQGQLVDGYDFISDDEASGDNEPGIDNNPDDPGDREGVDGSSTFHGTLVAGTIAAASNNIIGVAGIAWHSKIMPLRALGNGGGTLYDIMEAVKYAAGMENDSGTVPNNPADVINLSLGSEGSTAYEEEIYAEVRNRGIITIAAAGNDGSNIESYPAAYDDVVSVSAVTINETLASYSNFGSTIDVAAPGGSSTDSNGDGYSDGILSTCGDDSNGAIEMTYAFATGTSLATPHVSGVVALMKSLYPGLTPAEFDSLLAGGYFTRDIGASGKDNSFGYGLIDAYKAVIIARESGNGNVPAILTASPGILNFGSSLSTADIILENTGGNTGSLNITGFSANASWLTVNPYDVDANGLGTYRVTINRESLSDGTYSGLVTFLSSENEVTVSVIMSVGAGAVIVNGGYQYILLLDPDTYDTVEQIGLAGENGIYNFSLSGLFYDKTYIIYAGTDSNNDGYICDEGEACGAYLSLDKPVRLTVMNDLTGMDFTTDIGISLPGIASSLFASEGFPIQLIVPKKVEK